MRDSLAELVPAGIAFDLAFALLSEEPLRHLCKSPRLRTKRRASLFWFSSSRRRVSSLGYGCHGIPAETGNIMPKSAEEITKNHTHGEVLERGPSGESERTTSVQQQDEARQLKYYLAGCPVVSPYQLKPYVRV